MILEELSKLGVQYAASGSEYVKVLCPFHDDQGTPNLSIHLERESYHCFACPAKGNFAQYVAKINGTHPAVEFARIAKEYGRDLSEIAISPQAIDLNHQRLLEFDPLLKELSKRAVGIEAVRKYELGMESGRIAIPIYDAEKKCVNVQLYSPGSKKGNKFLNISGRKQTRFYPIEELSKNKIVVTAGPVKAIAGAWELRDTEYGCLSVTAGEGAWDDELTHALIGKETVYIIYDIDIAGKRAANKIAKRIQPYVSDVRVIELPFGVEKGGLDDYISSNPAIPLRKLLDDSKPSVQEVQDSCSDPTTIGLVEAYDPENIGTPVSMPAFVAGVGETPFSIPKRVRITCGRSAGAICTLCPVNLSSEDAFIHEIDQNSRTILGMVSKEDAKLGRKIQSDCRIPSKCSNHTQIIEEFYKVDELRISTSSSVNSLSAHKDYQPAFVVNANCESNVSYNFTGKMYPHPDTQVSTLLFSKVEKLSETIDTWELKKPERMEVLRADAGVEAIEQKLNEIYTFIEGDITKIYNRRFMSMLYDLTLHSVLRISPFGQVERGWLEGLVCGDSSKGKSDSCKRLLEFYQVGETIDCGNVTVAGLIGGNEQSGSGGKHFVIWGAVPRNDRGAVILEEMSKMPREIFQHLTEVRSSGVARITKISSKSTFSRVRLLINSNTRSGRTVSTYNQGVLAIEELIGSPPDVRRLDFATVIGKANDFTPPTKYKQFKHDVLRDCMMFAWTRSHDQVIFQHPEVLKEAANRLSETYRTEKIPLVDPGSQDLKLARIATAIAVRTWSVLDDKVMVNKEHILVAERFLDAMYSDSEMGYRAYAEGLRIKDTLKNETAVKIAFNKATYPASLADMLQERTYFEITDISDFGDFLSPDACTGFVSTLVRNRGFERAKGKAYVKTPALVEFLNRHKFTDKIEEAPNEY